MKFIISILLTVAALLATAQKADSISNRYVLSYRKLSPPTIYSYDESSQTHDYSNNWDFDGDGIKDELYFVGTGGAHLYYYLKVVLSADKRPREFRFAETDFPILTACCIVENDFPLLTSADSSYFDQPKMGFVVAYFGRNRIPYIIVKLDQQSYDAHKKLLVKKGISTKNVAISFKNRKTKYGSL